MKKRVKILASAFLFLGISFLTFQTSKATVTGYSVVDFGSGEWAIYRCTLGPEGCQSVLADNWQVPSLCSNDGTTQ
ncbi:hypothetical protein [Peijinzhouia sedimentorum]